LDTELLERLARNHAVLVTVEEGSVGGFGSLVAQHLAHAGLLDGGLRFRPLVLPDTYIDHDNPKKQYDLAGLNAPQIAATARHALGRDETSQPARA
ncbi:1-deoxy-D-xylulose-5-phosphate synthase, partial [Roseomonas sp. SSH11]